MPKAQLAVQLPVESIERRIYLIRGQKVMLDSDLAELYRVTTGNLNLASRRNPKRFPVDFMFQLTPKESESLLFQIERSKTRGGRRTPPYVFTEQGVAMLSSVLSTPRAIEVNVAIMRAFVRLREVFASHKDLAIKIEAIDRILKEHGIHINAIWDAIQRLIAPPSNPGKKRIGFRPDSE